MGNLYKIWFIDIETVPQTENLSDLSEELQNLWKLKADSLRNKNPERFPLEMSDDEIYAKNGGIYAEFGKIICISVGFIHQKEEKDFIRTKSFANKDEKNLLNDFVNLLNEHFTAESNFCGHNIKEFDIPYISRRLIINGFSLPKSLQIHGKKPWELNFIDTMDYWKFGDYKSFTSLKLLTTIFNIPTSKDDIDGSQVAEVFYKEDNLERIVVYCQKDVVATAQVWLRLNGLPIIPQENIESK
jgi:predicted PolB exonuclease-like 3'-5' exonuclease